MALFLQDPAALASVLASSVPRLSCMRRCVTQTKFDFAVMHTNMLLDCAAWKSA